VLTVCAAVPLALLGAETTSRGVGMADQVSLRSPWYFFTLDVSDTPLGLLIEHGHRLFGWGVGLCSIVLAVGLTLAARSWHRWLGWLVLVMVAAQGILGILRVKYNALGGPELAAFHGCFAQLAFATIVVVCVLCSRTWSVPATTPRPLSAGGLILCAILFVQIVFGAVVRHLTDPIAQRLHILLAFAVVGGLFWLLSRLLREGDNIAARHVGVFLALLVLIQPILGVEAWLRRFGSGTLPELTPYDPIRSLHHLLGTLIFTTAAALATLLYRRPLVPTPTEERLPEQPIAARQPMPFATVAARQLEGTR
jgi:hypothetical protein